MSGTKESSCKPSPSLTVHTVTAPYSTPYTKMPRHTYVDPDYSLTDEEAIALAQHKNTYTDFIRDQQAEREWQKRNRC